MLYRFPNELFYEVFEYLTAYDILHAFKGLNRQIDTLLRTYAKYDLNFKSWSKSKFDFVCQSIEPEQVRSLVLSNADDTCRQIHVFFGLFYIRKCVHLESLTLIDITEQDSKRIIPRMNLLSKLSHLSMKFAYGFMPEIKIPSLKYLSIGLCSMSQLQELLLCTPVWTKLDVQLKADTTRIGDTFLQTDIRQLRVDLAEKSDITFNDIRTLFVWMPKLTKLTFTAVKGIRFIYGEQWEHLIRTHLSQLKEFHFKIRPVLHDQDTRQILATFQTPFWLSEKHWIIHCDNHYLDNDYHRISSNYAHFYTLPYSGDQFHLSLTTHSLTNTCKDQYVTIRDLCLVNDCGHTKTIAERYYFPNLDSLTILRLHKIVSIDHFIDLSNIKHLTLEKYSTMNAEEFLSCISAYCTKLQSLTLPWQILVEVTSNFHDEKVCSWLTKRIRNLNVLNQLPSNDQDERKPLKILIRIFSTNIKKLSLSVTSIDDVLLVLNKMLNLHSIKIDFNPSDKIMDNNKLLMRLMQNVPKLRYFTHEIRQAAEARLCLVCWGPESHSADMKQN